MTKQNGIYMDLGLLAIGQRSFEYQLDNAFFEALEQDEILGGNCLAKVDALVRETGCTLHIAVSGTVSVTCDRCLDAMEIQLEPVEENCLLKLADEDGEDDNAIYVNREKPVFDLGWLLYELIAVHLPVIHSHKPGECNSEMEKLLQEHLAEDINDNEQ